MFFWCIKDNHDINDDAGDMTRSKQEVALRKKYQICGRKENFLLSESLPLEQMGGLTKSKVQQTKVADVRGLGGSNCIAVELDGSITIT